MFALYFTELVSAEKMRGGVSEDLQKLFGSLFASQWTLQAIVTGGIDWLDVYLPLKEQFGGELLQSFLYELPFWFYLTFHVYCLLNVTLGLFMDAASRSGQQATEAYLLQQAMNVFQSADSDSDGKIEMEDFEATLTDPDMWEFFDAIDLDISQAGVFFQLLDYSGDGLVSCAEFLCGCMRVRGTAKALDLLVLSREVSQLFDKTAKENAAASQANQKFLLDLAADNRRLLEKLVQIQSPKSRESGTRSLEFSSN